MTLAWVPGNRAVKLMGRYMLCMVLLASTFGNAMTIEQTLTPVDRDVPPFNLRGVDGTLYEPDTLQGRTWLINFWAVWCAPCLEELPALNRAWTQLQTENVGMLAINIGEEADEIAAFLVEHHLRIDFPIVVGDKIRTLGNWSGVSLPHTVVVSPVGKVVYEAVGPREWDDQRFIDAIVAVNQTPAVLSYPDRFAAGLKQFHAMTGMQKLVIVLTMLACVVVLMMIVRRRARR